MSYSGQTGEPSAIGMPAAAMERLEFKTGTIGAFVATGALTRGEYGLYRWEMPPNAGGAGGHFHRTFSEAFYVLSGTPTFFDGRGWSRAGAGDLLYIPEGGIHGFRNDVPEPASMLILFSPRIPREAYFQELYEIGRSGRTMTDADWAALYARHDQVMVEPA